MVRTIKKVRFLISVWKSLHCMAGIKIAPAETRQMIIITKRTSFSWQYIDLKAIPIYDITTIPKAMECWYHVVIY
jgi:hypothetical protein